MHAEPSEVKWLSYDLSSKSRDAFMTLDAWLSRNAGDNSRVKKDSRQSVGTLQELSANQSTKGDQPQAKRVRRLQPTWQTVDVPAVPRVDMSNKKKLETTFRELLAKDFVRELRSPPPWKESHLPWSVAAFHTKPHALIALQSGDLEHIQYDNPSHEFCSLSAEYHFSQPASDLSISCDDKYIYRGTDIGLSALTMTPNGLMETDRHSHTAGSGAISRIAAHPNNPSIVAFSDNQGGVMVQDFRSPGLASIIRRIDSAHHVTSGPSIDRRRPIVSALTWKSDDVLVTGSRSGETVKFWDIGRSRGEINVVHSINKSHHSSGIVDLASFDDGRVWALSRGSAIFSCTALAQRPLNRLSSPGALEVDSFHVRMAALSFGGANHVACGGARGVTIFTLPSLGSTYQLRRDTSSATFLGGYDGSVSGVAWHAGTRTLLSVSDDCAFREWSCRRGNGYLTPNEGQSVPQDISFRLRSK